MIQTETEFENTRQYVERLQTILLELRRSHSAGEYEVMSKAYLQELTRAQREIARFLALPRRASASGDPEAA